MPEQRVGVDMAGVAVGGVGAGAAGDLTGRVAGEAVGVVVRCPAEVLHQLARLFSNSIQSRRILNRSSLNRIHQSSTH